MLSMRMDAAGAEQLAKQLEVALAVEGVKAPEHAVRGAIASLLQMDAWTDLQRATKQQAIGLTYGNDPTDLIQQTMLNTVMTIADTVMESVHPSQVFEKLDAGAEHTAQPLLITCEQDDPPLLRVHFNGIATSHNHGMFGETCTLSSSDPAKLGHMLASVLCREVYFAEDSIEGLVDTTIEHDPKTGEDELVEEQGDNDDEWETCPHCRVTGFFASYALINQLPAPDEQFPAMEMGEDAEFTVFAPYVDQELMFCMVEDEVMTWLPEGTILPMRWSMDLLDIISGMQGLPPIEVGNLVTILFGMIKWPDDHFMNGIPETGIVKSLVIDEYGSQRAKIKVEGQRKLLTVRADCLFRL